MMNNAMNTAAAFTNKGRSGHRVNQASLSVMPSARIVSLAGTILLVFLLMPGGLFSPVACCAGLTQTITFAPLADKTYGDADFSPGATASSGLPVSYASSNPAVATVIGDTVHIVGAGTTDITASQAGDATYDPAPDVVQPLTVNKATPTLTTWPTATSITYGQTLASSTLTGGNASVAGTFAFTMLTTAPNSGTALQSVTFTPTDTTNYNTVTGSANVTVNPAPLTVTADDQSKIYGSADPPLTISYSGFVNGDIAASLTTQPTASTTAVVSSPVGTYPITVDGGVSDNYTFTYVAGTLTITKADPTVTAWPAANTITYGQTLASSTLTGGTASVPGTFAFTTPGTAPNAGTAAQGVTFTPEDATNYNAVTGSVTVTVNKADSTVTAWPTASAIIYGETLASSALTGGTASAAGTFAFTTPSTAPNAGTAAQGVTFSPTDDANYNTVTGAIDVTVNPAPLTVTGDNLSRTYGSANPALTVSYSGFINGDTPASLATQPAASTTADISSPVGTYPIAVGGGVSGNYTFTYIAGTLTIIMADPTVTAWPAAGTITYGETLVSSVLSGGAASVPGTFAFTAPATVPNAGTAAQAVTFTPADTTNYNTVTGSASVTVNKADPVVTVWPTASAITYGQPLASSTLTGGSGSVPGSFGFTTPATIPSSGTAAHGITFTPTDTANYNIVTGSVNVTVNRVDPTVTTWPMATAIVYGQTLASSLLSGGTASVDGTFAFTTPTTAPDAGTAAQSVTFTPADSTNYTTVTGSVSITVDKADPTISTWPTASSITYGQTLASSTLNGGSASVAGTFTFTTPSTVPNAGTVAQSVTFTPADTSNYNTFTGSADVIVNPAPLTVIADNFSRTYGTSNPALTINYSGFVNGETEASLTTQPTASTAAIISTSVGTYPITVSGGVSGNYTFTYISGTLTIIKADPTIIAWPTASDITYGQTLASSTLTGGSASVAGTFDFTTPTTASNAGTAAQSVTFTPIDTTNYNTVTGTVNITVTPAPLTVTADDQAKTYGAANPSLNISYSGFVNGDTAASLSTQPTAATTATSGSSAGTYPITVSGGVSVNYTFTYVGGTLTVNPAPLTVTADNQSKTYGGANPVLTIGYSGFVNGDTAASLSIQPTAATTATSGSSAGIYPITVSGGVSGNYTFTYVGGTLTVTPAPLTVTADNQSKTYGAPNPVLTISYSGFVNGDTAASLSTQPTAATTAALSSAVGTYPITVSGGVSGKYTFTYVGGTLTIIKADPTVTAWPTGNAITYGQTLAASTLTGGTASVVGTFAFTTPTTAPNAGTAAQSVTFTPTDLTNYNTVTGSVNVTVNKADPVVTTWPTTSNITYGQTLVSSSLTGGSASVAGTFAFTTPSTAPNAGTAAQSVTFMPTDATNYNTVTGSVNVTVNQADPMVTIWPTANNITYGQTLVSSTLTGGSASVAGTFAFTAPTTAPNAGTAAQAVSFTPTDTINYNTITGAADVGVNPAPLTVTAENQSRTYGSVNPVLTVTYSGFVNGDTAASLTTQPTASTTAAISSPVGTYPITVDGGASGNYTFTYLPGTLTIDPASLTVSAENQSKTFGAPNPPLTISYSGFLNGDTSSSLTTQPTASTTAATSSPAGTYPIDVGGGVSNNYNFSYVGGTLTIDPPSITVTSFTMPVTATDVAVSVTSFTATDSNGVAGHIVTESPVPPSADEPGWSLNAPAYFTFGGYGSRTAYAWAKDAFGNVSSPLSATVLITGSASTLNVNGLASPRTAGTAGTVTVTARDANGYIATTYRGTIRFASSDPQAVLPPDYTFTAADNGVHTFDLAVTFKTSGTQSVTAADIAVPAITGVQGEIVVDSAQAHSLAITGVSSPVTAGTASTVTVTARDPFGNIAKGYTGTVRFTSTDPQAGLPADFSFSVADAGVHSFLSQIILKTAGIRSLTVTDLGASNMKGTLSGITVNPGPATNLSIAGITSPRPAEVPSTVTVTLTDAHGNVASGYRGTVRFTSTDPQAVLPADYTFGAGDAGSHVFELMAVLKSAGIQTVSATDVADPGIAGTHAAIEVTPGVVALQAARVAAGFSHTAVVDTDGRVWTWGKNDAGQLGIGTTTDIASPAQVTGISGVVAIAAGYEHTVALKSDGTVWTWGSNEYGQIGDGTTIDRAIPVQVPGVSGISAIAAGSYHSVAIKPDGSVIGWGRNAYGQLGDRSTLNRTQPVQAYGITGVAALAAGANHTLLLTQGGDVWTMGANGSGQLGNGSFGDSAVPVRVQGVAGVKAVAAGLLHSLAIGNDGTAWAWGDNGSDQLGEGTNPTSPSPVKIAALSDVVVLAGGAYHTIALKDDGTLWTWGGNGNGQLGDGATAESVVPKQLQQMTDLTGVVALAAGGRHNVVVMGNGTVWTWGDNATGQLGDGSTSYKEHFVPVRNFSDISAIEVGGNHTVVLKTDGTVWTWGRNAFGQLGNGTLANSSLPGQVTGLTGIVAVAAGASHTAALKNDGTVWAWGLNESGQLGDGTVTPRPLPVQVQGLSDVTAIAAGSYFTLALKSDGTVWGCGSNSSGQLGDDTTISKTTPGRVGDLADVSAIAAGYLHALALKTDGTVWAWGFNRFGQLGDATNILRKVPVQAGIVNAVAIAAGSNHSLALQSDGTLWAWGLNGYGQLGDGTISDRNTPVEVTAIPGVSAFAAGSNHSMAMLWDRSVWLWGDNFYGQLGTGSGVNENLPQQLQEFFDVGTIAAGGENSLLVKNDGSLWTVGDNDSGQLGNGTPYLPAVVPGVLLGNDDMPPVTTASLPEGTYLGTQTVALSSSEPATIYYTLDGTTPTTGSARYDSPLSFFSSTLLKFFAVDRAGNGETVETRNYVVNPQYPLNLYLQGGGSGRIDISTGGSCTGACSQSFLNGTTVDLTPVPFGDSVFMGWSGCDSVLGQVCRVTITSAKNVTAHFDPAYTLSLSFIESGTVSFSTGGSCTGACARAFRAGTTVELTASGNGTVFEGWGGCDTASGSSCIVAMNGSRSVTASFGYLVMAGGGKGISIQQAYNQVSGSDVLSVRAAEVTENINFDRPVTIRLAGGYNSSFTDVIGVSTLQGTMTVSAGSVIVERMVIR